MPVFMPALLQKHRDLAVAGLLGLLALCVYLKTLCPTFYWGDSAELATVAYTLGISHPTGYPVWTMLAKLWSLVFPFGTFIWRINVLSAVFGAVAVGCIYGGARMLGASRPAAAMGAGLFAFSSTFWQQCLFAETYSLTACWCAALLGLAFRWRARGCRPGDLSPLALASGFAMTNGQINTLFLPGLVLFVLWCDPGLRRLRDPLARRVWLRLLGLACLPLLSYVYLPLRAHAHPAACWGDPETPFAFWYHVTGRAYTGMMFHGSRAQVWLVFRVWARNLNGEFAWPLVALAGYGLATLARRAPQSAFLLAWVMTADVFFTVHYDIYNHYIYFLPCYVSMTLLMAAAADDLAQKAVQAVSAEQQRSFATIAATCLLLPVPFQMVAHWQRSDLHNAWACYDYGHNLLASAPPGSILADNGEDTSQFAMAYLQIVDGFRPDVTLMQCGILDGLYDPRYGRWANKWFWDQLVRRDPIFSALYGPGEMTPRDTASDGVLRRLVPRALAAGRPLVIAGLDHNPLIWDGAGHHVQMQTYLQSRFDLTTAGLVTRVYPRGGLPSPAARYAQTEALWKQYRLRGLTGSLYMQDEFLIPLLMQYADAALMRGHLALHCGDYETAEQSYHFVLELFVSGEASAGLDRVAEARRHQKAATGPALQKMGHLAMAAAR